MQEASRLSSRGFQAPGMGRAEHSMGSAGHAPERAPSSNSDSSSSARPSASGGPTHENSSMLAKGAQSPSDPSTADMQSSTRQPQSAQLFANSYSGMARNRSSDALGAGGRHRLTRSAFSLILCPFYEP